MRRLLLVLLIIGLTLPIGKFPFADWNALSPTGKEFVGSLFANAFFCKVPWCAEINISVQEGDDGYVHFYAECVKQEL